MTWGTIGGSCSEITQLESVQQKPLVVGKKQTFWRGEGDAGTFTLNISLRKRKMKFWTTPRISKTIGLVAFLQMVTSTCIWKIRWSLCLHFMPNTSTPNSLTISIPSFSLFQTQRCVYTFMTGLYMCFYFMTCSYYMTCLYGVWIRE